MTGGEGGYLKKVTLDDTGGVGVCGTPKKGDVIKVQPLLRYLGNCIELLGY